MLFLNYSYRVNVAGNTHAEIGVQGGVSFLDANLDDLDRYHQEIYILLEMANINPVCSMPVLEHFFITIIFYADFCSGGFSNKPPQQRCYRGLRQQAAKAALFSAWLIWLTYPNDGGVV
jgi:hypothetical protein